MKMGTKQRHGVKGIARDLPPLALKQDIPPVFTCIITDYSSSPPDNPSKAYKVRILYLIFILSIIF